MSERAYNFFPNSPNIPRVPIKVTCTAEITRHQISDLSAREPLDHNPHLLTRDFTLNFYFSVASN